MTSMPTCGGAKFQEVIRMKKIFISLVLILTLSINISTTDAFSAVKSYKTGDIHDEAYYVEYNNKINKMFINVKVITRCIA